MGAVFTAGLRVTLRKGACGSCKTPPGRGIIQ